MVHHRGNLTVIAVMTLGIVASIGVIVLTVRKVSSPILSLVKMAERIAVRDFSSSIEARTEDEIGLLTRAFNARSDEINDLLEFANAGQRHH